ncbi:MAG TPA: macrolide ABC transporter ATP-binding protein [Cyanobacteria bacterium UBA8553]|nr:macrolide ABC transporter ATP-binding protein [Cyanobacteria bacterium UBA8553]HAJ58226.1 macrolide ABC transporter ATP-binding protein [Cyanobacteria bacterium UBA8543]
MSLSPLDLIALTCNSLRSNLLRSTLTTLGVFMGVAAVSATLQVGSISRTVIEKQLAEREAPQLSIFLWGVKGREAKLEDMEFFRQQIKGLQALSAYNFFSSKLLFQGQEADSQMRAVSPEFFLTSGRKVLAGRAFTSADFTNYRTVVVIDEFLAEQLFQGQEPIGKIIFDRQISLLVIGVMEGKLRSESAKPTGELVLPMSTYRAITGSQRIDLIAIRPKDLKDMNNLEKQIKQLLKQRFPDSDLFVRNNVKEILKQKDTLELASRGLTAVGIISLLIGGVGIANITIAAVIERTPEIGLRRAIGAKRRDILLQFILEAALLSLVGGTAAIATVHGLTIVVTNTFKLPYQFESSTAVLSLSSALLVGVGAGFIPALRASQLDPVKALRSS